MIRSVILTSMQSGIRLSTLLIILTVCVSSAFGSISIDSTRTTPSNCANDGSINIYAHSSSSLLYAIINGPDIRPPQSGNSFGALPVGEYQLMLTNFSSDTVLTNAIVGGTYQFPDFAPMFVDPYCDGTSTGMIVGNADTTKGRPPFSWLLTNTGTGSTITQTSDSFFNVPSGNYSIRLFDSCQAFATRFVTLIDHVDSFYLQSYATKMLSCDSAQIHLAYYYWPSNYFLPLTITVQTQQGTFQHIVPPSDLQLGAPWIDVFDRVGGVSYGDNFIASIADACGRTQTLPMYIPPYNMQYYLQGIYDSCLPKYRAVFNILYIYVNPYGYQATLQSPTTVITTDNFTGQSDTTVFVDSFPNPYTFYDVYTPYLNPGSSYTVTVQDTCGHIYVTTLGTPVLPNPVFTKGLSTQNCFDSTAGYSISWYNYFTSQPVFKITSGPATVHSSKLYFTYNQNIHYPITISPNFGTSSTNDIGYYVDLIDLGIGKYYYQIQDSCGHSITDSFEIFPQDVSDYHYTSYYEKGCPGLNKLFLDRDHPALSHVTNSGVTQVVYASAHDSLININDGYFYVETNWFGIGNFVFTIFDSLLCFTSYDTVFIPPYDNPKIDYATQIKCNGTVNVGFQPDSTKGIPPYRYEVISGPQTSPLQSSQFFRFTQPGNYIARISDTCGFARTFSFYVDTLAFQQIVKVGSSCLGNSATLVAQHSPYATYIWHKPNGTSFTGDSLHISPTTSTDYGLYQIEKIVVVNNCTDTFYTTYLLSSNSITYQSATICNHQSFSFGGNNLTVAGTYYDTIATPFCDSITVLNLSIGGFIYDSVSQSICSGQSIILGLNNYTSTGVYRDTFPTAGCDSIRILNLTVTNLKRDSVARQICTGQTITVGANVYSTTGIYRDTFSTTTCDSVYILNLTVTNLKRDSVTLQICTGQTITVGSNVYFTTGIYRDTFSTITCDSVYILNLTVTNLKRDSVALQICTGQTITVGANTYSTTGIYRDTFSTTTCDSVYILNLTVTNLKRDSVALQICTGQKITVRANVYSTTGIYRDTFSTTTCDSVYILNLTVTNLKRDSVALQICTGQTINVGANVYSNTGIYRDTFSTATCDSVYILNLTVTNLKRDSVALQICTGQTIIVGANVYSTTGIYRDTFSTAYCDSVYILNLTVLPSKRDTVSIQFCEGESVTIGYQTFTLAGSFTDTFPTSSCDSLRTVLVSTFPKPTLEITATETEVDAGDTIQLNATSNQLLNYLWTSIALFNNAFIPNPIATIVQSSWITAQVSDTNNCTALDSVFIKIKGCEESIFVPNAFTPNGDGTNDVFYINGNCIRLNTFYVFNRWGEKMWDTNDISQGWNGYYKGIMQPMGVYVYLVNYSTNGSVGRTLKGSVTLVR